MSTLVGHFVSSPREREKRDSRGDEREGQERKRNRNEREKNRRNKSCRRTASSPAGYILYCNIFIIKPYNIGHTNLDVFVCKSFCHIDVIIQV